MKRKFLVGLLLAGVTTYTMTGVNVVEVKASNYRDIKIVDLMFTIYCNECGELSEGDYSIVSEKGQIWCENCQAYEELNEDSSIVKELLGRE